MTENTKESTDLKNLDLKDLGGLLKLVFGKNGKAMGSKTAMFIPISFLTVSILSYFIYGLLDNPAIYDQEQARHNSTSAELANLTKKFDEVIKGNEVYFTQLFSSPKSSDELSGRVTRLVSNHNLDLINIDLQKKIKGTKKLGIGLEVSGTYFDLLRFSTELNKHVAASQVLNLDIKKERKSNNLNLKLTVKFAPPPKSIPKLKLVTASDSPISGYVKALSNVFETSLDFIISSAHAGEGSNLSPFQKAYSEARKQGLYEFEFTKKTGEILIYATGLSKESMENVPAARRAAVELDHTPRLIKATLEGGAYDSTNFRRVGFVEAPESGLDSGASEMRDPFLPPVVKEVAKKKRPVVDVPGEGKKTSSVVDVPEEDEQYYLSGVLVSDEMSVCIIITPEGESKIYAPGDRISSKVTLTNITFNSIQISSSNESKVIVLGEQVN
ncbi:MAG TPA: hypothetical protein EYQ56_02845 [Methylophilaceae bacterium]|nr:hypothetical protein [Methylophilaceae bacterium]HIK72323.1 hypothetical protein [Gammaproteobacteria bacterium]